MRAGELLLGRFEMKGQVAAGAMGVVHRAVDRQTERVVAVKILRPNVHGGPARFKREARLLATFDHPHIVRYITHGTTEDGAPALVMEWVDGEDLAQRLLRGISEADVVIVARQIAEALGHVHKARVVHRDVKPANVILEGGDVRRAKLIDFGLARPMGRSGSAPQLSALLADGDEEASVVGFLAGTPTYMAPEQVRGEDLDARTDLFALGCFLFKCLSGQAAFAAPHARGVLSRVLFDEHTPLRSLRPDVLPNLDALVRTLLDKDRDRRPASAEDVMRALDALGATTVTSSAPPPSRISEGEQRLVCFVLAAEPDDVLSADADMTVRRPHGLGDDDNAREIANRFGARIEVLADGSFAAAITGDADRGVTATDQVARAARLALALAGAVDAKMSVVLATGRAELGVRPVGDGIDRAIELHRRPTVGAGTVRIDEVTAGLLDPRFDVHVEGVGDLVLDLVLLGEREAEDRPRTLLGKPTPCVGRELELAELEGALDACVNNRAPRALLVTGAAGMGKSRLRHEWLRALRARRHQSVQTLMARGDPMAAGAPLGLIAELVRAMAGVRRGEQRETIRARLRARVARNVAPEHVPRVFLFLAELIGAGDPAEADVPLRAARVDPHIMYDQLERAWCDLLAAECGAGPLALVLEDLHWCDPGSIRLVEAALKLDVPLFVVAFARPEVHGTLPEIDATPLRELRLRPLGPDAGRALAHAVLGADAPGVDRVVEQAGGNPFFLEELLRAQAEGRTDVPETLRAVLLARFERLSPHGRRVLRAASVIGPVFWRTALDALLGDRDALSDDDVMEELAAAELVSRRARSQIVGEQEWWFRHAMLRDAAYAMLTERDRVVAHALVGRWLESRADGDAVVIAEHFERGNQPARATSWWHRAAVQAMEGGDVRSATAYVRRAMTCGASGDVLGALYLLEASAERWVGRYAEAARAANAALERLPAGSDPWYEAVGELGASASATGDVDAVVRARDALLARDDPWNAARTIALAQVGGALLLIRHDLARPLLDAMDSVDPAAVADHPLALAYLSRLRALVAVVSGAPMEAFRRMREAAEAFHRAGDRRNACLHAANAGFNGAQVGAREEAARLLKDAQEWAHGLGILSLAKKNLARLRFVEGDFAGAAQDAEWAAKELAGYGHKRLESYAHAYTSQALLAMGDVPKAMAAARRAVDVAVSFPGARVNALAALSRAQLGAKDVVGALATAREAMALFDSLGALEDGEWLLRVAHGEALAEAGFDDDARRAVRTALDRLELVDAQVDVAWKHGFRTVPEVLWTVALAKRLGVPTGPLGETER
jgi:tetratricopeptide (TPR) repeat protein